MLNNYAMMTISTIAELPKDAADAAELLLEKSVDPSNRAFHCANELQVISKNPVKILQG